ncbi:unnamed protein product [Paramecium sonneborni]|uniref:Uncharacterized protein n=1 Tax=Paramecium sonneborni TaxID=65129 RepID=A0A8S1PB80_9CILI|nr:unnamed protein product [Paramecium sonneborni]
MINIQPRTREQREAQKDKDLIEKTRIDQRVGFEARGLGVGTLIHQATPQSSLYVAENERFDKDFAIADKRQRDLQLQQKGQVIDKRRMEGLDRETKKWEYQEKLEQKGQQKLIMQTQTQTQGKRNQNGLAYNPITLQYDKTQQGNSLKEQDDQVKVRQYVRAQNLDQKGNAGFNILTGESRNGVEQIVPNHLKNQYQQKLRDHEQHLQIKTHSQFNN